jgi:SAM-dependent methyltransferase
MSAEQQSAAQSWSAYWAMTQEGGSACLPGAPTAVAGLLEAGWKDFFRALPDSARVLDLGTGGGAVLRQAQGVRTDLALVGVDYAPDLPAPPPGIRLLSGVQLEALPFADDHFDAVTSQFAIEYADQAAAVAELGRVLKPGGRVRMVAHHADGMVHRQNDRRRTAVADMTAPEGLVPAALRAKRAGTTRERETLADLDRILKVLQEAHGRDGVVQEVLQLLAPMVVAPDGAAALERLLQDLRMEERRLSALSAAVLDEAAAASLAAAVAAYADVTLSALEAPGTGLPFAWCIA